MYKYWTWGWIRFKDESPLSKCVAASWGDFSCMKAKHKSKAQKFPEIS